MSDEDKSIAIETSPVICQRCHTVFPHFVIEQIAETRQLRSGKLLLTRVEATCLECGWIFYWNIREKAMEKMATEYSRLSKLIESFQQ